ECRCPPDQTVDFVTLTQQQLCQIRTILPGDSGHQCHSHHCLTPILKLCWCVCRIASVIGTKQASSTPSTSCQLLYPVVKLLQRRFLAEFGGHIPDAIRTEPPL